MTVSEVLTELAACLSAQNTTDGNADFCWVGVMPGQQALHDGLGDGCEGGLGYTRLSATYPAVQVGVPDQRPANCRTGSLGIEVEMGVMRVVEVRADAPSPEESLEAAEQQVKDMYTMRKAILCCSTIPANDIILGNYAPYGPIGAVVGGTWTIYIGLP